MSQASAVLHEPFESGVRQREATVFAIWIFLASELLLFGGMICVVLWRLIAGAL